MLRVRTLYATSAQASARYYARYVEPAAGEQPGRWVGGLAGVLNDDAPLANQLSGLMVAGYVFKFLCALLDTLPLYWLVPRLSRWLEIDPDAEHRHLEDPGPESAQ